MRQALLAKYTALRAPSATAARSSLPVITVEPRKAPANGTARKTHRKARGRPRIDNRTLKAEIEWHRTLVRAGLEGRGLNGPHSLRRTLASLYTGPIRDLSELLGHSSIHTTALYLRGRSEAKRKAVEALDFTPVAPAEAVPSLCRVPSGQTA